MNSKERETSQTTKELPISRTSLLIWTASLRQAANEMNLGKNNGYAKEQDNIHYLYTVANYLENAAGITIFDSDPYHHAPLEQVEEHQIELLMKSLEYVSDNFDRLPMRQLNDVPINETNDVLKIYINSLYAKTKKRVDSTS